uniref:Uncharacterized protein n=1 Tax=Romanomermis culicivorax TaxID=13658 RepID=A0A915IH59_ROMCU
MNLTETMIFLDYFFKIVLPSSKNFGFRPRTTLEIVAVGELKLFFACLFKFLSAKPTI